MNEKRFHAETEQRREHVVEDCKRNEKLKKDREMSEKMTIGLLCRLFGRAPTTTEQCQRQNMDDGQKTVM